MFILISIKSGFIYLKQVLANNCTGIQEFNENKFHYKLDYNISFVSLWFYLVYASSQAVQLPSNLDLSKFQAGFWPCQFIAPWVGFSMLFLSVGLLFLHHLALYQNRNGRHPSQARYKKAYAWQSSSEAYTIKQLTTIHLNRGNLSKNSRSDMYLTNHFSILFTKVE